MTLLIDDKRNRVKCQEATCRGASLSDDNQRNATIYDTSCLKDAWGVFLTGLGDWDWWVTLTFRDIEHRGSWTRPGWAFTAKAWQKFTQVIEQRRFETLPLGELKGRKPLTWVRCRELQHWRGIDHFHALIGGVGDQVRRMELVDWWWQRYGIARILAYDRQLGAGFYLCKYVSKELGDIQFSDSLDKVITTC